MNQKSQLTFILSKLISKNQLLCYIPLFWLGEKEVATIFKIKQRSPSHLPQENYFACCNLQPFQGFAELQCAQLWLLQRHWQFSKSCRRANTIRLHLQGPEPFLLNTHMLAAQSYPESLDSACDFPWDVTFTHHLQDSKHIPTGQAVNAPVIQQQIKAFWSLCMESSFFLILVIGESLE